MSASLPWIEESEKGILVHLIVTPGSSRSDIIGLHDERLKIAIKSPPTDGKANKELVRFLCNVMGIAKKSIAIIKGQNSRRKSIIITALSYKESIEILQPLLKP